MLVCYWTLALQAPLAPSPCASAEPTSNDCVAQCYLKRDRSTGRGSLFCESVMYAALLSGCVFAAALGPAVPLNAACSPASRITWTGLYDEKGRPVTFEELRDHKFPPDADKYGNCPWRDATESPTHPIWTGRRFYGADGPEPLKNPWNHMMSLYDLLRKI